MTEPQELKIGGVSYQANQVASHSATKKTRVDKSGNVSAFTTYHVKLKDGTTLKYEAQSEERQASVYQEDGGWTKIFGFESGEITDTPNDDQYTLYGCEHMKIKANRTKTEGLIFKDTVSADADRIVVKDRILDDGTIQVSKNNIFLMSTSADRIKLQDDLESQRPKLGNIMQGEKTRRAKDTI